MSIAYVEEHVFKLQQQVAKLERQMAFLLQSLELEYHDEPDTGVSPEILDLVRKGNKIEAIKRYRMETGASLKAAKDIIDSL